MKEKELERESIKEKRQEAKQEEYKDNGTTWPM